MRLALEGALVTERRRQLEHAARERLQGVARTGDAEPRDMPTPAEMRAAMLSGRRDC